MPIKDGFRSTSGKLPVANARVNKFSPWKTYMDVGKAEVMAKIVRSGDYFRLARHPPE
jgi:hypothetical protein